MVTVKRITKEHVTKWEAARATAPPPFTLLSESSPLHTFVTDNLDTSKVYIIHLDRHPRQLKSRVFTVPLVLNSTIAALLIWRLFRILPWYAALLGHVLGRPIAGATRHAALVINTAHLTWSELAWAILARGSTFMLDFVLFRFVAVWPWGFFLGTPGNPVRWRWTAGFRDTEVVIRGSRGWGAKDLIGGAKKGAESPFWKTRVLTGIDEALLREKTGYLLMGKDWDLEFGAMTAATKLVDAGKTKADDWEKSVWVHKEGLGWCVYKAWEKDRDLSEEEQRQKMTQLKERLTAMGKERLFWRWIEIVQYESSKPGVFDRQRQSETATIIAAEFAKEGVDFEALVKDIGGIQGTPGM